MPTSNLLSLFSLLAAAAALSAPARASVYVEPDRGNPLETRIEQIKEHAAFPVPQWFDSDQASQEIAGAWGNGHGRAWGNGGGGGGGSAWRNGGGGWGNGGRAWGNGGGGAWGNGGRAWGNHW